MVANLYQVIEEKVTTLEMEIYPTKDQDYRAWIGTVLLDTTEEPRLSQVVVDDESAIRDMIQFALRRAGMDVSGAADAREALNRIS